MNLKTILSWVGLVCGVLSLVMNQTYIGPVLGVIGFALGTWIRKSSKDPREISRARIAQVASFFGVTGFVMLFIGVYFLAGAQG